MTTAKKLRSPIKWHGGKSYLARRIAAKFTPHLVYVEPFAGGLSVLLNKERVAVEIAADLNPKLINLWAAIGWPALAELISDTEYSRSAFDDATRVLEAEGTVGAWAFLVNNRMSRGGLGKNFAWSERLRGKRREGGPVPGEINSWDTFKAMLPDISRRVRNVRFRHAPANEVMREADGLGVLVYCDPPYLHETRTVKKAYEFEMDRCQHEAFLGTALSMSAKVYISGYRSVLYDEALAKWTRHEFDMPNHSGQGKTKQRRVECLWESP